eukprot:964940_1
MAKFSKYFTTILSLVVFLQLFGCTQAAHNVDKDDLLVNGYSRENESELTDSIPDEVKKQKYDFMASEENTSTDKLEYEYDLLVSGYLREYEYELTDSIPDDAKKFLHDVCKLVTDKEKMDFRIKRSVPAWALYVFPDCRDEIGGFRGVPNYASVGLKEFRKSIILQ